MTDPTESSDISARRFRIVLSLIFVLALALRLIHLHQIRPIPLFDNLIGDAEAYDQWAQRIAAGDWIGRDVFYQAPLYPYFLAIVYKLLGHNLLTIRIVQCLLGSLACVLLALAGRSFFSRKTGIAAGALLALYPSAIFFDALIQKSVLDLFLICLMLALAGATLARANLARWLAIGLTLGALMLTRENAAVLVIVILAWALLHPRLESTRPRVLAAGAVVLALLVVILPVALRNKIVGGEFHLTTSQLGPNLFIGNNAEANGAYEPLIYGHGSARYERADATRLAESVLKRKLTPGEVSRFYLDQVSGFINNQPIVWLKLMGKKTFLFFNATEMGDTEDQYVFAEWSRVLRVLNPWFHFGVACAIAAVGAVLTIHRYRDLWLLYAIFAVYAGSVIAFYVMARYRFPIVPVLLLFAAAALIELWDVIRRRRTLPAWMIAACVIAVAAILFATRPIADEMIRASTYQSIGFVLNEQNKLEEAYTYYERAKNLWPSDPVVHIMLGRVRLDQKRPADALPHFVEAIRIAPEYAPAHVAYGAGLLELGRDGDATAAFRRALELDPANERAAQGLWQLRPQGSDFRLNN